MQLREKTSLTNIIINIENRKKFLLNCISILLVLLIFLLVLLLSVLREINRIIQHIFNSCITNSTTENNFISMTERMKKNGK